MSSNTQSHNFINQQFQQLSLTTSPTSSTTLASSTATKTLNGPIFVRRMKFYISDSLANSSNNNNNLVSNRTEKTLQLTLEVEPIFNELRKEIKIRILDSNDPFFIYMYLIDSVEFEKIKTSQNLLISFESFPAKLINLFEKCDDNDNSSLRASFILCLKHLTRSSLTLDIIELNEFKNFTHLSFVIPSASDDFIRSNFCQIYRKLSTENDTLLQTIATLEDRLSSVTVSKSQDLQSLQQTFRQERQQLESRQFELERQLTAEKDKNYENEKILKANNSKLQHELQCLGEKFENERKEWERSRTELRTEFNMELSQKMARLREQDERTKQVQTQLEQMKSLKERTTGSLRKTELELDSVRADLAKANEIIRKLQLQAKAHQGKLGILNQVTHKQEEIVGIKESTVERLTTDLRLCLQQLKLKQKEITRMEQDLERMKSRLSQSELESQANRKVVASLNRELELKNRLMTQPKPRPSHYSRHRDLEPDDDEEEEQQQQDDIINLDDIGSNHHEEGPYFDEPNIDEAQQFETLPKTTIPNYQQRRPRSGTSRSNNNNKNVDFNLEDSTDYRRLPDVPMQKNQKNSVFSHREFSNNNHHRTELKSGVNLRATTQQPKSTTRTNQRHVMAIPTTNTCSRSGPR